MLSHETRYILKFDRFLQKLFNSIFKFRYNKARDSPSYKLVDFKKKMYLVFMCTMKDNTPAAFKLKKLETSFSWHHIVKLGLKCLA